MYYFKVIDNDVYKFKVNYDLASVQKYLYYLAIDLGKTVHSNYVTEKPHKNADKIYKTYNVKYFGKSKDFKPLFKVDCEEVVRPSLYKLIEKIINYLNAVKIKGITFVYNLTTNAILLPKYMNYLVENDVHLLISIDGSKQNNIYRVKKEGKESFDIVFANIKKLKDNHPNYFDSNVNFNSVLHDKNSVDQIYSYIKTNFDKTPYISELNRNGIAEDKKEEFNRMFHSKEDSIKQAVNCGSSYLKEIADDSHIVQLDIFMQSYFGNTYKTIPDLFFQDKDIKYFPTSTCVPFSKKIFLTVQGKILPCEKVGQQYPLGYVRDGKINLDSKEVKQLYLKLYTPIVDKCKKCLLWKNCEICVFYLPKDEEGQTVCPYYLGNEDVNRYFSTYIYALEKHPDLLDRIENEILID